VKQRSAKTRWIVVAVLGLAGSNALAQGMFRCTTGAGAYLSDRPCSTAPPAVLKSYGPVREAPPGHSSSYSPSMAKAPDTLSYMSVECAQMNDAIRTGPTRGLKGVALSELHTNYRLKCAEDEQLAHRRLNDVRTEARQQKQSAQAAQRAEQAQARLTVDQCSEMLRILAAKRQRVGAMTAGERGDMALFESSYQARCKG
jgi:hypothetical protein